MWVPMKVFYDILKEWYQIQNWCSAKAKMAILYLPYFYVKFIYIEKKTEISVILCC